ncbi:hypothetical protein LA76x_0280 [Lysobacter antibioticus]|uniref:Uncharacterized protein n=1 Tax=Lysobacter antibioticus TaxID=84531 RepID=A0A0S2F4H8_LYSAN|nr:hypothetical protein LA76x_0280 [Lysobacter antibioticus]
MRRFRDGAFAYASVINSADSDDARRRARNAGLACVKRVQ